MEEIIFLEEMAVEVILRGLDRGQGEVIMAAGKAKVLAAVASSTKGRALEVAAAVTSEGTAPGIGAESLTGRITSACAVTSYRGFLLHRPVSFWPPPRLFHLAMSML